MGLKIRVFTTVLATVLFIAFMMCVAMFAVDKANASVGNHAHMKAHTFEWDYNAEHGVYCAWRHGFEGISCVHTGY